LTFHQNIIYCNYGDIDQNIKIVLVDYGLEIKRAIAEMYTFLVVDFTPFMQKQI
jgi:hypothetical protein